MLWWQGDLPHPVHLEEGDDDDGDQPYDADVSSEQQQQQVTNINWDIQTMANH